MKLVCHASTVLGKLGNNLFIENEAELLRRNCVTTKMLSVFAKWKGSSYLRMTLQKVLERLIVTAQDLDLELDPARTSSPEELQKNALQLRVVTKVFIDDICNSACHIPISFRKICSIVSLDPLQPVVIWSNSCFHRFPPRS
jgi:neurofibromin 1